MRNLTRWSAAPAKNVDTALTPKVNVLRGLVARATTPLLPDVEPDPPGAVIEMPLASDPRSSDCCTI